MPKIAIVGCGKIADAHASQIIRIKNCEIIAACDTEELMAKQLSYRFPVKNYYSDLRKLLDKSKPDVVHITTPPQTHYSIGMQCLESGCHIYVEKPFTMNTEEAMKLLDRAKDVGRKVTVGHDAQFSDVSRRMRKLVQEGYIGDKTKHMDSYWCYDLSDVTYATTLLSNKDHWARKLPGGLLHNIISHGISKIAEFLTGDSPQVIAHGFVSPFLRSLGEENIVDELRVIIQDEAGVTANFIFSSQMQPSLHQFRIFGSKNGLLIDEDQRVLIKLRGGRYKSYAENFIPPAVYSKQYLGNLVHNIGRFLAMDFHTNYDKKSLIESFYRSIEHKIQEPIPYREILLTSTIMDAIFYQIRKSENIIQTGVSA